MSISSAFTLLAQSRAIGITIAYFSIAHVCIVLSREANGVANIWLANALLVGILLRSANHKHLIIFFAGSLGNFLANLATSSSWKMATLFVFVNMLECWIALALIKRTGHFDQNDSAETIGKWLWQAVCLAPMLSALLGAVILSKGYNDYFHLAAQWYAADALGIVVILPLMLLKQRQWRALWHTLALKKSSIAILIGTSLFSFSMFRWMPFPFAFTSIPLVIIAIRCKLALALLANLTTIATFMLMAWNNLLSTTILHVSTQLFGVTPYLVSTLLPALCVTLLQQESRRRWRYLQVILQGTDAMIGYWDKNLVNRLCNRAYEDWFGKKEHEILGKPMHEILGEHFFSLNKPFIDAVLQGKRQVFQRDIPLSDGSGVRHSLAEYAPYIENGEVDGFFVHVTDITPGVVAQRDLANALAQQQAIFEHAGVGIKVLDLQGCIKHINRTALQMLGYEENEVHDKVLCTRIHAPEEMEEQAKILTKEMGRKVLPGVDAITCRARTGYVDRREWLYMRKDGSRFPGELTISPIFDIHANVTGFLGIITDLTERKQKEAALRAALAEKETLLREVYHRVKNNLQVVSSLFNLQIRSLPTPEATYALKEAAARVWAMGLVHEMLYRSDSLNSINLESYVNQLCHLTANMSGLKERNIYIHTEIAELEIGLDQAVPLGLLIHELLANSIKHAFPHGESGEIKIRVDEQSDGYAVLKVSDNGIGLDAEKAVASEEQKSLGLRLVKSLCKQVDGQLEQNFTSGTHHTIRFRYLDTEIPRPIYHQESLV